MPEFLEGISQTIEATLVYNREPRMSTNELYLILHKVRGEPTFDVASKCMIGKDEGWIIPTSGHRAYPIESWHLLALKSGDLDGFVFLTQTSEWDELPDHYDTKRDDGTMYAEQARAILISRGILKLDSQPPKAYRRA